HTRAQEPRPEENVDTKIRRSVRGCFHSICIVYHTHSIARFSPEHGDLTAHHRPAAGLAPLASSAAESAGAVQFQHESQKKKPGQDGRAMCSTKQRSFKTRVSSRKALFFWIFARSSEILRCATLRSE